MSLFACLRAALIGGVCFTATIMTTTVSAGAAAQNAAVAPVASPQSGPPDKRLRVVLTAPTRAFGGDAPDGWFSPEFDDRAWTIAPGAVAPRGSGAPADRGATGPVTAVEVPEKGTLFVRLRFDVPERDSARVFEVKLTYRDAFVAFLNGTELARGNLAAGRSGAQGPRGVEPETMYFPLGGGSKTPLRRHGNVLAVAILPAPGRTAEDAVAPSGRVELGAASGVRLVRGPYLVAPTDGAVSIAWETDLPARGAVELRPAAGSGLPQRFRSGPPATRQVVRLSGLRPGQKFQYVVRVEASSSRQGVAVAVSGDAVPPGAPTSWHESSSSSGGVDSATSNVATFETAPPAGAPLRFAVYGDMRAPGHAAHAQVVAALVKEKPPLVLNTGDLVANGVEESGWQRYFEITAPLGAISPIVPALGNHDAGRGGLGAAKAWRLFGLSPVAHKAEYTSFDWGGVHFIILDTNRTDAAQKAWLERDLANARRRKPRAIFAFCHEGPWSHGPHGNSRVMERDFAPLLAAARADMLFSGHDHIYERGVGTTPRGQLPYIVTGGGGAPLYNPTCEVRQNSGETGGATATTGGTAAACPPSVAALVRAYHYIVVEIQDRRALICPRRPDETPVEPCFDLPLH